MVSTSERAHYLVVLLRQMCVFLGTLLSPGGDSLRYSMRLLAMFLSPGGDILR